MIEVGKAFCTKCNGRGHVWATGHIVSHDGTKVIANTYKDGGKCEACNGTGEVGLYLVTRRISQILIGLTVIYFAWQILRVC